MFGVPPAVALERAAFRWAWLVCYRRGVPRWYQIMAWALWVQADGRLPERSRRGRTWPD